MTLKLVLLSVLLVWNILVLCAYGLDKSKAIQHKRRISEKALLLQTLIFGGIGAFLGGKFFGLNIQYKCTIKTHKIF